jgi:hypothetical protein
MAVSAKNVLGVPYRIVGNQKESVYDVTMDSSYTEKGEALTRAALGLNNIERAVCTINAVKGTVNVVSASYDPTEQLLHLYDETPAEVASEANVEGMVVRVVARGN